jgi:sulfite exporter TauE/SafE
MDPFTIIGIASMLLVGLGILEALFALGLLALRISYAVRGKRWKRKLYTLR